MKIKRLSKIILIIIFFAGTWGFSLYLLNYPSQDLKQTKSIATLADESFGWKFPVAKFPSTGSRQLAYSDIRDPGGMPQGLPMRLKIPTIGVDSAIEDAYITADGRMDVPAGSINVAWFALGPNPGDLGSAVIGGHYGIRNGVPFVFYNLDKLKIDDKVYVINDKGETLAFIVRSIKLYSRNADATTVFTSDDNLAHLNIITCEGIWNKINGTYPSRRVVFTDAISSTDATIDANVFPRPLKLGTRGKDVVMLQTILEQKKFLRMPLGVAKGYFGALTRLALTKYQASVDLPANGVFGSSTIAKLIPEQSDIAAKTSFPLTSIIRPSFSYYFQVLIQFVKSLYTNPIYALITFSLLVLIVFMTYKITRR